ncbi:NAD(P)H-binding protein [Sorangium sp. So ce394]|uniref:SDR family oxidoreductase n=1 Tax=Sorangium sp. So ce394 TaxID=3133310 RepID=UPI003F5BC836
MAAGLGAGLGARGQSAGLRPARTRRDRVARVAATGCQEGWRRLSGAAAGRSPRGRGRRSPAPGAEKPLRAIEANHRQAAGTSAAFTLTREKSIKILVTGATGTVDREIVKQLAEGGHHVRALSRNPGRAKFPDGVEAVAGDLAAPETFAAAFEGVEALHLINFGGDDCAPLQTGEQLVALARQAGVRRITVLLGGSSTPLDAAVAAGGIGWTFLQPVEFMARGGPESTRRRSRGAQGGGAGEGLG